MILEGTTSSGAVVPVQVTTDGKVVAEGRTGAEGPQGPEGPEGPQGPEGPAGSPGNLWSGSDPGPISYTGGSVGIGTSSPTDSLDVVGAAKLRGSTNYNADETAFFLGGGGSIQSKTAIITDPVGDYGRNTLLFCQNDATDDTSATSSDAALAITSSGNVGIGVASPTYKLQVKATGSGSQFAIGDSSPRFVLDYKAPTSDTPVPTITSDGLSLYYYGRIGTTNHHVFHSGPSNTESVRIDSSARLLVGTSTAPAGTLAGDVVCQGSVVLQSPNGTWWAIEVEDNGTLSVSQTSVR